MKKMTMAAVLAAWVMAGPVMAQEESPEQLRAILSMRMIIIGNLYCGTHFNTKQAAAYAVIASPQNTAEFIKKETADVVSSWAEADQATKDQICDAVRAGAN